MWRWFEDTIVAEPRSIVFLDTYQKATPGISSFDDTKQSLVLHKLANLTRRLEIMLVILDHVRKQSNGPKRRELTIDDLKGTGGKAQNADCVILIERTPDKKQIKLQAYSKDFEQPVRILLNIAPRGSQDPKFTYAADLEQLGASAKARGTRNQQRILETMAGGSWAWVKQIAVAVQLSESAVLRQLNKLIQTGQVKDNGCPKCARQYRRVVSASKPPDAETN